VSTAPRAAPVTVFRSTQVREDGPRRAGPSYGDAATPLSDAQLIALARESHHEAFTLLYAAYKGRIYTFLLRLLADVEAADDVAQDTFTKAYAALPRFASDHRLLPWLYRVASNAAIDHLRRRKRIRWLGLGRLAHTGEEPLAEDLHGQVPERELVQATLRRIPPENAVALLLHVEGYSYTEIAEIQGVTLTAVRSRIARARAAFRREYTTPSNST